MKDQLLYFYRRNNRQFYILKLKGKSESLFSGNTEQLLSDDFDNLQAGDYICLVANNEKGFAGCPEFEFSVSKSFASQNSQRTPVNQNFEELIQKAYEKGQSDLKEKQARQQKEEILEWLIEKKPLFEKIIKDLSDDDDSNDTAAKTTFMDVISEIPDAMSSLESMMNLGKN